MLVEKRSTRIVLRREGWAIIMEERNLQDGGSGEERML